MNCPDLRERLVGDVAIDVAIDVVAHALEIVHQVAEVCFTRIDDDVDIQSRAWLAVE